MYKTKHEEIQNKKCYGCKFCIWDEERREEVCDIKGCVENSKYVEYDPLGNKEN